MNLDLKSLYKTLNWHNNKRDFGQGKKVGIFILVPENIAKQFPPEGKEGEDSSPPHITLNYIGDLPQMFEDSLDRILQQICKDFKSFTVKLGNEKKFINDENQEVYHSPIKSKKLHLLHDTIEENLKINQIPYSTKYPEYKPHITIEYVNAGVDRKFPDICPQGEWIVDSIWVWGMKEPRIYFLK